MPRHPASLLGRRAALLTGVLSHLGSAQPELGPSFLMPAIASALLGATPIRPGRYNCPAA